MKNRSIAVFFASIIALFLSVLTLSLVSPIVEAKGRDYFAATVIRRNSKAAKKQNKQSKENKQNTEDE